MKIQADRPMIHNKSNLPWKTPEESSKDSPWNTVEQL